MQTVFERVEKPVEEKMVVVAEKTIAEQLEEVRGNLARGQELRASIVKLLDLEG